MDVVNFLLFRKIMFVLCDENFSRDVKKIWIESLLKLRMSECER